MHNNYATFAINKTIAEVKAAFDAALQFILWVEGAFSRFETEAQSEPGAADETQTPSG